VLAPLFAPSFGRLSIAALGLLIAGVILNLHAAFLSAHDMMLGRGGLTRMLLGSVADKVVRGSSIPVLVCRQGH